MSLLLDKVVSIADPRLSKDTAGGGLLGSARADVTPPARGMKRDG